MKIYTKATERLKQLHREFKGQKSGIAEQASWFDNCTEMEETGNFHAQYSNYEYLTYGYKEVSEEEFIKIVCPFWGYSIENAMDAWGYKEQSEKLNYELDFDFITQVAERMQTNKGKYEPYNWKKPIDTESLKQALFRHVLEVMKGNYNDDGRELGHLEAIAANAMMLNYQIKNK